ncbi:MAG: GTP-sensing pleiotropic transcriptional regulator CodY [Clostridia bacterium]|nr:GTP-sensing pleiotropic transcriptional regulator CodY [Clostridia bacterium]
MSSILTKMRKLNWVLSSINDQEWAYGELSNIFCQLLEANVYVVGDGGKVLAVCYQDIADTSTIMDPGTGEEKIPKEDYENMVALSQSLVNVTGEDAERLFGQDYPMKEKYHTIVPIINNQNRYGVMIFARYQIAFTEEDLSLCEYGATVIGLEMRRKANEEKLYQERLKDQVKAAIDSLSYSELEAVVRVFEKVQGEEVVLVASKIADNYGITRSVVVNALRKLESAGVISSRSLGMKGTRIKITNDYLRSEISHVKI